MMLLLMRSHDQDQEPVLRRVHPMIFPNTFFQTVVHVGYPLSLYPTVIGTLSQGRCMLTLGSFARPVASIVRAPDHVPCFRFDLNRSSPVSGSRKHNTNSLQQQENIRLMLWDSLNAMAESLSEGYSTVFKQMISRLRDQVFLALNGETHERIRNTKIQSVQNAF
jgi:hypothetical protein